MDFLQDNLIWAALAAVSGGWLLFDFIRNQGNKSLLSPIEATLLINREEAVVVDVRDQGEYSQGHIPNARHLPLSELARRSNELEKFKERPIILCCASGARSASAIGTLKKAGFEKLYNLRGGLFEWEKAGQPISRKRK
ncbi:rhodanese-like domain-containing protein [Parazoarcus communis]|uniref:Rhodanese-like domain-containing protein n=1 Tax=Parazoarcus communis SWub3 = DSM 12120 TaxID=1121029 RepID=A0A323UV28_9RHOO|nr:rhodanese-like domain-containing protein [Parazoarcus communis]NMG68987.1 rhodanese-like domain-containing protein [Parazoarcus communis SWub3 = DSM 12120]PZA16852.1 rhodanese-like domain-containing protein [Azoarcus communis] [Parazoarcus communis SWub3 = DSM 12120]